MRSACFVWTPESNTKGVQFSLFEIQNMIQARRHKSEIIGSCNLWTWYRLCNGWQQYACAAGAWIVSRERAQVRGTITDAATLPTVFKSPLLRDALFAWLVHTRMPFSNTVLGLQVHCFRSFVPFSGFFIPMQSENVTKFAIGTES